MVAEDPTVVVITGLILHGLRLSLSLLSRLSLDGGYLLGTLVFLLEGP